MRLSDQRIRPGDRIDPEDVIRGWPGWRTRDGRSGLDPLDAQFELAQMTGRMVRMAFSGNYVSDNPATAMFVKIYIALYVGQFALTLFLTGAALLRIGYPDMDPQVLGLIGLAVPIGLFIFFQTQHFRVLRTHPESPEPDEGFENLG